MRLIYLKQLQVIRGLCPEGAQTFALWMLSFTMFSYGVPCTSCFFVSSPVPTYAMLPWVPEVLKIPRSWMSVLRGHYVHWTPSHATSTSPFLWYYLTFQRLPFKLAISQRASRGQLSPSWPGMPRQAEAQRGIPLGWSHRLWLVLCQARQKIPRADQT